MKHYTYKTKGVCSQVIEFDLSDENKIFNVKFYGGCNGNLKAISKLVEGKNATEIISILKGNQCGMRPTSCADQFATALTEAIK